MKVIRLDDIGTISGNGVDKRIIPEEVPVRLLNYLDVYHNTFIYSYDLSMVVSADQEQLKRCQIKRGDIFFTPSSEIRSDIGRCAVAMEDIPDGVHSYHVVRLRPVDDQLDVAFSAYVFGSEEFRSQASKLCEGSGTRYVVTLPKFRSMTIRLPITREEQTVIAAVLLDFDKAIIALEQLIKKKAAMKHGIVHALMTGKSRLPGCYEKWKSCRLDRVVVHHSGNSTLIKGRLADSAHPGLYPGYSASGQDVWHNEYSHNGEALVVSAVGSRCGRVFRASGKWVAIANTHVIWPDKNSLDVRFLAHLLDDEKFWLKGGTGQPYVLFKQSLSRHFLLPNMGEQKMIADILDDVDQEICRLSTEVEKLRVVKRGVMQRLLTGRTRLVEPVSLPGDDST